MKKFSYASGVDGSYTVPAGHVVLAFSAISVAGGSMTIAPGGAGNPTPAAGPSIVIPAGVPFGRDYRTNADRVVLPQLGAGTVFAFTDTDSYYVELAS